MRVEEHELRLEPLPKPERNMTVEQGNIQAVTARNRRRCSAYYLTPPASKYPRLQSPRRHQKQLRMKSREPRAVRLERYRVFIHPYGSSSAFHSCCRMKISKLNWGV